MDIFTPGLLIELNNDSLEIVKSKVDINGLFLEQAFYSCLLYALGTRKIHQMYRSYSLDITPRLRRFDVNNEDAVRTSRLIIFRGLAHHSVRITDKQIIQSIFFVGTVETLQVVKL